MRGLESLNQLFGGVQRGILSLFFLPHKHVRLGEFCLPPDSVIVQISSTITQKTTKKSLSRPCVIIYKAANSHDYDS